MECVKCVCVWLVAVRGLVDKRIGFGLYQSYGNKGSVGCVSVFGLRWCRWVVGLDQGLDLWVVL